MNSSSSVLLCRYRYDSLDRLTSHVQRDTPQRHRFYCKSRLATDIQGANGYAIVQHGDLLLAQQQCESGSPDTTLLATDLQRSVLHTLKKNAEPQLIAYSPYGYRSAANSLSSLLGFNGERPDPVIGHYLLGNGYRGFNPYLMRFNSPDSLSPFKKGGLNAYAYCLGDPVNNFDQNGHAPLPNFVSKALTRVFGAFGSSNNTYMSGPEKIFQNKPEKILTNSGKATNSALIFDNATLEHTAYSNGDWLERTIGSKGNIVRLVRKQHGGIHLDDYFNPLTGNKQDLTLLELAYSKIPGKAHLTQPPTLPHDIPFKVSSEVDRWNIHNALSAAEHSLKKQQPNTPGHVIHNNAIGPVLERARNGNLMGVHPSKVAELIRNDIGLRTY